MNNEHRKYLEFVRDDLLVAIRMINSSGIEYALKVLKSTVLSIEREMEKTDE